MQHDHAVREISSAQLKLRTDLVFTPQMTGTQPYYMVEDPLNSRYFRLGQVEYTFASLLDGHTTIHDALAHLSTVLPNHQLTEVEAAAHCRWLVSMDLAHTVESADHTRLAGNAETLQEKKTLASWNPLVFRLPLGCPDRQMASLAKYLGWLFSPAAAIAWLVLLLIGGYQIIGDWDRFHSSSQGMFAPDNWLYLALAWLVLKVLHEVSHGVVCQRHGGHVRETGLMFILFAPLAYVDVTLSWRFRSRLARMHVAAAGMYLELLLAALAALVWSHTESGWLNHFCYNTIVMASVTTLLFNANPLMKFDGYYILSDALAMPNLYVNGQSYLRYWVRRYLLGMPAALPEWSSKESLIIAVYAWASCCWRLLICLSMTVTAATLFQGAGVALAVLGLALWFGLPSYRFLHFLVFGEQGDQPNRLRFLATAGTATVAAVLLLGFVPWPGTSEAPVIVEYSPPRVVRAASPGFVRQIHVTGSQQVEQGQLLMSLENRELTRELADLELQIRQSLIRARQHEQQGELGAQQAESEKRIGLENQRTELESQVEQLTVRAPAAGKVIRRNLASLLGTYVQQGTELVTIGQEAEKELRVSIEQNEVEAFAQRVGKMVRVNVAGQPLWESRLEKVIPRATRSVPHAALAAANGGPLPVNPVSSERGEGSQESYELLAPRFTAIVHLSGAQSHRLRTGQQATVSYRPCNQSIGEHLYETSSRWLRERLAE